MLNAGLMAYTIRGGKIQDRGGQCYQHGDVHHLTDLHKAIIVSFNVSEYETAWAESYWKLHENTCIITGGFPDSGILCIEIFNSWTNL